MGITLSLAETCKMLRSAGMKISEGRLSREIAAGTYPFGRLVSNNLHRRTFEIFRSDVERFLMERGA